VAFAKGLWLLVITGFVFSRSDFGHILIVNTTGVGDVFVAVELSQGKNYEGLAGTFRNFILHSD